MFEKEAEEYADNQIGCGDGYYEWTDVTQAYQKGAEFGYNKAKEEMQEQIEKLIDFTTERTECCDVCPITDTCINSEGTCPYAGILAKDEEAVTRKWLMRKIAKEIKKNEKKKND